MKLELSAHEDVVWSKHSSWIGMYPFYLRWLVLSLVPAIIGLVLTIYSDVNVPWGIIGIFTLLALCILGAATWLKRIYRHYTVTNQRIFVKSGIFGQTIDDTHLERIQNTRCHQSLLERMLNVGDINFDTAGTNEGENDYTFFAVDNPNKLIALINEYKEERQSRFYNAPNHEL